MSDFVSESTREYKSQIQKILLPIDGSTKSLKPARHAVKIAKQEKAEIICIHAIASLPYPTEFRRLSTVAENADVSFNFY